MQTNLTGVLGALAAIGLFAAGPAALGAPQTAKRQTAEPRSAEPQSAKPLAVLSLTNVEGGGQTLQGDVGGAAGAFLFDTGWGFTAFTPAFSAKIGCQPWGRVTGFRATGERSEFQRCNVTAVDLGSWRARLAGAGVVDLMRYMPHSRTQYVGAVGLDAFDGRTVTLQSRAGRLIVESPASARARVAGAVEVPIKLVRDVQGFSLTANLGVETSAGTAWFEIDSGNRGSTLVANHIALLAGLATGKDDPQPAHLRVAKGVFIDEPAYVTDLIMDGNVGHRFLETWDLTLDLGAGRAWLAPAKP